MRQRRRRRKRRDSRFAILEFVICLLSDKNPFVCDYDMHSRLVCILTVFSRDSFSRCETKSSLRAEDKKHRQSICILRFKVEIPKFCQKFPSLSREFAIESLRRCVKRKQTFREWENLSFARVEVSSRINSNK